jgi:hypothetical protein
VPYALATLTYHRVTKGQQGQGPLLWVAAKVYKPAKTVADCFKYRNKIGLDVTLEALRDYRQKHRSEMDELWRFAKICRVERVDATLS